MGCLTVRAVQGLLNTCWHPISPCPMYVKSQSNATMKLHRRDGRWWWITSSALSTNDNPNSTMHDVAFYFAKSRRDEPINLKWESQIDGIHRALTEMKLKMDRQIGSQEEIAQLQKRIDELEKALASGITADTSEPGIPVGRPLAPTVRAAPDLRTIEPCSEEVHIERQALSWGQRLHKTVMGIGQKTERRIGEVLGLGECVVLEDLLVRFFEQPPLLEVVVSLTVKQSEIRAQLSSRMARYKAAMCQLMTQYQTDCASLILPALLQCFSLQQPPKIEKMLLRELHHILMHCPHEAFSAVPSSTRADLFSLTHRLIRRKSLSDVVIGLKLVRALLRWSNDTAYELHRYGTLQAVESLYKVEQHVQMGLRRVMSGTTKPSAVRELAITVAQELAAISGNVSEGFAEMPLAKLAPKLAEGNATALTELKAMLKGGITAFELSECGIPAAISVHLNGNGLTDVEKAIRAEVFCEKFKDCMPQLVALLHDALFLLEELPVYRHQAGGAIHGVKSLLHPCKAFHHWKFVMTTE